MNPGFILVFTGYTLSSSYVASIIRCTGMVTINRPSMAAPPAWYIKPPRRQLSISQ